MNDEQYRAILRATRGYLQWGAKLEEIPDLILHILDDPAQHWRRPDNATFHQFVTRGDEHGLGQNWDYFEKVFEMQPDVWQRVLDVDRAQPGRRPTVKERSDAQQIREVKADEPVLSTRQIADRVGVSNKTVASVLKSVTDITDIISNIGNTPPVSAQGGTRADYTLQRVRHADPAMYERVIAGELSAHKAARDLGLRNHTVSVRMDDATSACATISKHMNPHLIEELVRRLREVLDDRSVPL